MPVAGGGALGVAVAQPQKLMAEGLACAVEVEGIRVSASHDPDELVDHVRGDAPGVVVLDLALVEPDELRPLVARIHAASPGTRILLLANDLDRATARVARDEDIEGLVLKTASAAELGAAVRQVAA